MKVGDILRHRQSGKRLACVTVDDVRGNCSHDSYGVDSFGRGGIEYRSTTDAANGNAVYEVHMPTINPRTDVPREEAELLRTNCRIPEPPNLDSDRQSRFNWEEFYRLAWKDKMARRKEDDR